MKLTWEAVNPFRTATSLTSLSAFVDCSSRSSLLATIWARLTAAETRASQRKREVMMEVLGCMVVFWVTTDCESGWRVFV